MAIHQAIGFVETLGLTPAMLAADVMLKAADVTLYSYENVGSTLVTIMVSGNVAAVKAAVESGVSAAESVGKVTAHNVIPSPSPIVNAIAKEYTLEDVPPTPPRALAMIETFGLVNVVQAADAMEKSAAVDVIGFENVASGYISVLAFGDVGACQAAVSAGVQAVQNMGAEVFGSLVIPSPHQDLYKITQKYTLLKS